MKYEEKITENYFKSLGYNDIVFEPKGNRTPDFVINNEIAVEVRRLNQHYKGVPLEAAAYSLIPKIENQLKSFGNGQHQQSAFVGIYYSRPIKYTKQIQNKIEVVLETHSDKMEKQENYYIADNLRIKIFPSPVKLEYQYNFGTSLDCNQGGFVLSNILDSLKQIIPVKYNLIQPFKTEYKFWWLALVDFIGYGIEDFEIKNLRESIDFDLKFDKVYIISCVEPISGHVL